MLSYSFISFLKGVSYAKCLLCRFCEKTQALIHGDLHTGSVMVTHESTQVIVPEFVGCVNKLITNK